MADRQRLITYWNDLDGVREIEFVEAGTEEDRAREIARSSDRSDIQIWHLHSRVEMLPSIIRSHNE